MENSLNELTEAPLGVATDAPLHTCLTCSHFCYGFEVPFCAEFEKEIDNINDPCSSYTLYKPSFDLPF